MFPFVSCLNHSLDEADSPLAPGFDICGRQQVHSDQYVNRAHVLVVGESGFRRVDDPHLQGFFIVRVQAILQPQVGPRNASYHGCAQ